MLNWRELRESCECQRGVKYIYKKNIASSFHKYNDSAQNICVLIRCKEIEEKTEAARKFRLSNRETPSELRAISEVLSPAIRSMTGFPNLPLCITFSVLVAEFLISADLEDCLDAVLRIALRSIQFRVQDV